MGIRQQTFCDYDGFVEKFQPKKTTDDCYTPENVYRCVLDYVFRRWQIDPARIVRPFWPGADYQACEYPPGCVVVDNPPFSIIKQILKWYTTNGISFFLFCPGLVFCGQGMAGVTLLPVDVDIIYENGASVNTSFVHSFAPDLYAETDPELYTALKTINDQNAKIGKKVVKKTKLPQDIATAASIKYVSKTIRTQIRRDEAVFVRKLDHGEVFGGGLLLSRAAAERAAAERAAAERAAAERAAALSMIELSDRERKIQEMIGHD